ncbi:unnamed protein product [Pleuronectes platessa]|uniref:Fibronectin type-III domain-containing protein n=1 Tax=Pleuronectes platessa TaxID=8262 RepID=A0A9N7VNB6_PLEPL|nr:unnamed protein product [Pleuronectes platessa]
MHQTSPHKSPLDHNNKRRVDGLRGPISLTSISDLSDCLGAVELCRIFYRPPAPVNVSVMHLRADSATVSWEVPEGDIIIGFSISQQRQDGHMQRFIREVNTTSRSCVLWDLEEETDYIIQVQSIGLYGESQASKKVHFRTLKKSDLFPSNSSNQDDPTVQGLDKARHLQTGEMIIIVVVLVMWAGSQAAGLPTPEPPRYDIIKDNDSSNSKEKAKPLSERARRSITAEVC